MELGIRNRELGKRKPVIHNSKFIIPHSRGFSLVEVLLAVSVFSLIVTALTGGIIYGQQSTAISGMHSRAAILADEGLEAARNIRDENYSNLPNGTYGLAISGSQWIFTGSSDTTDIFTRQMTIADAGSDRKQVTSAVTWQQNPQRMGNVSLITYLTNWKAGGGGGAPSSCAAYCQSLPAGYTNGTCRANTALCTVNSETYESGGDAICTTNFPSDVSHDTCCCAP